MRILKNLSLILLLSLIFLNVNAQDQGADKVEKAISKANEIFTSINQLNDIIKYKGFRKNSEEELKNYVEDHPNLTNDQLVLLRDNYRGLKSKFDDFVDLIKADILNPDTYKNFKKSPDKYAFKYVASYDAAIKYYRDTYVPTFEKIKDNSKDDKGPEIIPLLIEGAKLIIDVIANKKASKETLYAAFGIIDDQFGDKFYMHKWEVLLPKYANLAAGSIAGARLESAFSQPLISDISGSIKLIQKTENGYIDVPLTRDSDSMRLITLVTNNSYETGSEFKLKVKTDGFIYIFSQNADGFVTTLYPYSDSAVNKAYSNNKMEEANSEISFRQIAMDGKTEVTFPMQLGTSDRVYKITKEDRDDNLIIIVSKRQAREVDELKNMLQNPALTLSKENLSDVVASSKGNIVLVNKHEIVPIFIKTRKKV